MKIEDVLIKPDEELLDPKDDAVFKFLFTSENEYSRGALKSLISELTGHEVKELRLSMNEPPVDFIGDKQIRFDVNCLFNDGQRANVEMCMYPNENEAMRSEFFASRLFVTQETKGKKYNEIADAYQISIIDKKELTKDNSVLHVYEFYDSENKVSLGGKIHIIHIELKKYDRLEKTAKNMDGKERWGAYLKWIRNKEKIDLVNELIQKEEGLGMATRALRELTRDEEIQFQLITAQKARMDRYNDIACAEARGKAEGIEIGEVKLAKEKREIALKSIAEGLDPSLISRLTNLSIEEIEALKEANTNKLELSDNPTN